MSGTPKLNILAIKRPEIKILHMTWLAFFIGCMVWFNMAPLLGSIQDTMGLTDAQVKTLLILNLALTIPARIIIGMLVDKLGPRLTFSALLIISSLLCFAFALADSFETLALSRFLLGFVGAGFVIGIRMIGEWFPARQTGVAQGIYAGWGNFGSAAAAMTLPALALWIGGDDGWRYSIGLTGLVALGYGLFYYFSVTDTPPGSTYFKPKKVGAMEVSTKGDFILYAIMQLPIVLVLGVLAWKLSPANMNMLSSGTTYLVYLLLAALYFYQIYHMVQVNGRALKNETPELERFHFSQVAVLDLVYMVTFGSELAVVSMLPLFFKDTFGLSILMAGVVGASFSLTNFFARPGGGWISDSYGRKKALLGLLGGLAIGFVIMSFMGSFPILLAVLVTMLTAMFVTACNGAVYAVAPLIKRRMTGQIAGMVGAFGNVGGVIFLTIFSFVSPHLFFLFISGSAVMALLAVFLFFKEPTGQIAEVMEDGTVQMIDVK